MPRANSNLASSMRIILADSVDPECDTRRDMDYTG